MHTVAPNSMSAIENGEPVTDLSYRRLEQSLQWNTRDVKKVFAGEAPTPVPQYQGVDVEEHREQLGVDDVRIAVNARWNMVLRLIKEVMDVDQASPRLRAATWEVAYLVSDSLTREVLRSDFAARSKEILDRMYESRFEVRQQLIGGRSNAVETTQTADAQAKGRKGEEALVPDEFKDGGVIDADVGSKADDSGVGGTQDGEQREDLAGG